MKREMSSSVALATGIDPTVRPARRTVILSQICMTSRILWEEPAFTVEELEEAMQKVMDQYAGGIGTHYQFNEKQLAMAEEKIKKLQILAKGLAAADMHELMFIYELKERLTVCLTVIAHLRARKETRWHSFAENLDYPEKSDAWLCYVNSKKNGDQITMIRRDLVKGGETYEHRD